MKFEVRSLTTNANNSPADTRIISPLPAHRVNEVLQVMLVRYGNAQVWYIGTKGKYLISDSKR